MGITEKLARKIGELGMREIPDTVLSQAGIHMADTMACMVCGMEEKTSKSVLSYLDKKRCLSGTPVLGNRKVRATAEDAALYYGICAHVCDYDNLSRTFGGHPGAVILPVVLALGQEVGETGRPLLQAFIAGVETASMVGSAFAGAGLDPGWNPTTILGIFGAVAAGAVLMKLEDKAVRHAIAIAAGEASGIKANYGTAAKDLTVGHTAAKAVFALKMAALGLGGAEEALGEEGGLFHLLASGFDEKAFTKAIENHQSDFLNPGIILKPYPSCRGIHNGIDGMMRLVRENRIVSGMVERIICGVQDSVLESNRYPDPANGVEGKFSLSYCLALCLIHGNVAPEDFTEEAVITEEMRNVMEMVQLIPDPDFTDAKSGIEVRMILKDGRLLTARGCYAKGDPGNPMTEDEFREKLNRCFSRRLSETNEQEVIAMMTDMDQFQFERLYELLEAE